MDETFCLSWKASLLNSWMHFLWQRITIALLKWLSSLFLASEHRDFLQKKFNQPWSQKQIFPEKTMLLFTEVTLKSISRCTLLSNNNGSDLYRSYTLMPLLNVSHKFVIYVSDKKHAFHKRDSCYTFTECLNQCQLLKLSKLWLLLQTLIM